MSVADLVAVLWRQRDLLERLTYRLECEQLLLAAGRTRWLAVATSEIEALLEQLPVLEMQRGIITDQLAGELGLPPGATLEDLAGTSQPPWSGVLTEHRQALLVLTAELAALAETNRHLLSAGAAAVEAALAGFGGTRSAAPIGYDAHGRADLLAGRGPAAVDQAL
jgi:hypothetical protein